MPLTIQNASNAYKEFVNITRYIEQCYRNAELLSSGALSIKTLPKQKCVFFPVPNFVSVKTLPKQKAFSPPAS